MDCSYITPDCDKCHLADTARRSFLVELGAAAIDDNRFVCSSIEVSPVGDNRFACSLIEVSLE